MYIVANNLQIYVEEAMKELKDKSNVLTYKGRR